MIPLHDDNPTRAKPVLTVLLIAANALVFLYQLSLGPRAGETSVYQFGAIPAVILGTRSLPGALAAIPPAFSLLTSMFLHGGFMHLIGNMIYLWIFGNNIEDAMGRLRFLVFYLACGFTASFVHILMNTASEIPAIGASGAISAVLGAYLLLYPSHGRRVPRRVRAHCRGLALRVPPLRRALRRPAGPLGRALLLPLRVR